MKNGCYFSKKKELRKMVKFQKNGFLQNILDQLNNLEENNPQQYWKLVSELKELESRSSSNVNVYQRKNG